MPRSTFIWLVSLLAIVAVYSVGLFSHLGLTGPEQIALVILLVTSVLWISELIPLFATSFVIILLQIVWLLPALTASGGKANEQAFLSPFFSDIILLFLGGFVLSAMLHRYNLDKRIAQFIIARTGGEPSLLLLAVIVLSAFFSMWMSNTATAAMMFAVTMPVLCDQGPDGVSFSKSMALAIPFACNLGGMGTPIGTPPNAIAIAYLEKHGLQISFADWMMMTIPLVLLMLFAVWRMLMKMYPSGNVRLCMDAGESGGLSKKHYSVIAIFVITCFGWLTSEWHGLSLGMVSLFPIIVCFGAGLLNTHDFRTLSWDVLFMLGGGLSLGVGLKESGLIGEIVHHLPTQTAGWVIILAFSLLALGMSTFISNTATANLMIPIAVSLGDGIVGPALVAIACSAAMALPVSTPPNAIAFASGYLHTKDMALTGIIIGILVLILAFASSNSYWSLLGL